MRILGYLLVVLFVTTSAMGQQINPVPDYIFRNQMSVGRNAPTDTAAYLSVGPRYGANKGLMPPMVVDTNAVTGVKRNGLLIFSVQLNNFAYWDSTTSRFRKITAEAVVDSVVFATRAWRKKGDDSLGAVISQRTDTALLSTRAYRQKGVDSLVTLISTLGGGTVLSVSAGTGMNFTTITTSGSVSADTSVLSTRAWRKKGDDSLGAVIAAKVNISDTSTMLSAYLRKADTTSMLSPYLRKTDTTAMLTPYVRTAGFGLTKGTQALSVDSALMATRARVQKGIDSVASLVTTTDSVVFSTRAWRQKGVDSVAALANTKATATGTTNYLSKFTGTSSLGNSIVYATTSEVGISTPSPTHPLDVNGRVRVRTIDSTATGMNMLYADVDGVIKKAAIPAGGSGTVTSVSAGTGMSFTTITTTGAVNADTVALATRAWRQKGIDSVANTRVGGTGTINRVPKFTATGTIGNGSIVDSSSSAALYIANNGSVGINVTPNAWASPFRVIQGGGANHQQFIGFQSNDFSLKLGTNQFFNGSNYIYSHNGAASRLDVNAGNFIFNLAPSGTAGNPITFTERMTLTASGRLLVGASTDAGATFQVVGTMSSTQGANFATSSGSVGVGTSSPSQKLSIVGADFAGSSFNGASFGDGNERIRIGYQGTSITTGLVPAQIVAASTLLQIASRDEASAAIAFNTGSGIPERMRLTAAGRLLVGTTTEGTNTVDIAGTLRSTQGANFATTSGNVGIGIESPSLQFQVGTRAGINSSGEIQWGQALTGNNRGTLSWETNEARIIAVKNAVIWANGSERMRVDTLGFVGIGTNSPSQMIDVTGRARIRTIDSTSSPINMLWADNSGVIRKTAVPASVVGSGNTNYIPKWTNATALGNSVMYEQGGEITVGSTTDFGAFTLQVDGTQYVKTSLAVGTTSLLADADVQIGATSSNDGYLQIAAASNGVAQISFGDGTGNDRFAGYMAYYHQGDSLVMGTASTQRFTLNATGLGLGTAPAERLDVNGRARVRTIDSSGSPINMLWADNNGVIRKAAVPAGGGGGVTSVATGFGIDGGTITSTGTLTADTVEMATRVRVQKGIDSVGALARVTGSGTTNYVPLWTGSTALGNSSIYEASSEVLIGTTSSAGAFKLQISGVTYSSDGLRTGNPNGGTAATWKLGSRVASSVALDGTQYIEVDIGGTLYYLATVSFLQPKP